MSNRNSHDKKQKKVFPSSLLVSCVKCHGSARRAPSSLCSEDFILAGDSSNMENDQEMIMFEVLRRQVVERNARNREKFFFMEEKEEEEVIFPVNSYCSRCSSGDGRSSTFVADNVYARRSVLEEFRHCKGWPFGLGRTEVPPPMVLEKQSRGC